MGRQILTFLYEINCISYFEFFYRRFRLLVLTKQLPLRNLLHRYTYGGKVDLLALSKKFPLLKHAGASGATIVTTFARNRFSIGLFGSRKPRGVHKLVHNVHLQKSNTALNKRQGDLSVDRISLQLLARVSSVYVCRFTIKI